MSEENKAGKGVIGRRDFLKGTAYGTLGVALQLKLLESLASAAEKAISVAAGAKEFTFVNFSDPHVPNYGFPIGLSLDEKTLLPMHNQQCLLRYVKECLAMKPKPAFAINKGDTGDAGWMPLLNLYQKLMQPMVSAGIPIYTVVGNHDVDYAGIGVEDLAKVFDPLGPALIGRHGTRYSFDYQDCHFVILNNCPVCGLIRLNPMELEWLRNDLKKVDKDKRVFVFLHAFMAGDDTYDLVEMLQHFRHPVIFRGHRHSEAIGKWGGVTMVITGALYGGGPKAGSYRIIKVLPEKIVIRTQDFAKPAGVLGPEQVLEPTPRGPQLSILKPPIGAAVGGSIRFAAEIKPVTPLQSK